MTTPRSTKKKTRVTASSGGTKQKNATPPSVMSTAEGFLWDAPNLMSLPGFFQHHAHGVANPVKIELQNLGVSLNQPQWDAWQHAIEHRLTLIWGPPGTGKSETLRALVEGLCLASAQTAKPLRLLISATKYSAFDNILEKIADWLGQKFHCPLSIYRLRSAHAGMSTTLRSPSVDVKNETSNHLVWQIRQQLINPKGVVIVASTPDQIFNFVVEHDKKKKPTSEFFDCIIVDEASQMDVGHMLPLLCAATAEAQIVLAGDPMQLSPISGIPPPEGTEYLLGSVYTYIKERFILPAGAEQTLQINYRSNAEIVAYGRIIGYPSTYRSNSPNLRLDVKNLKNYGVSRPTNWPMFLEWSPAWTTILDPDVPVVCFNYDEGRSGQSNWFESHAIASLLWLLWETELQRQLLNEQGASGSIQGKHTLETFWRQGVGVVTPHSAQRAHVIMNLKRAFGATFPQDKFIREAVDTVERFQGQQRDVIMASFAVGDPDIVAQEDEFLLNLNRFNVMASRPRAKLVVFVSNEILDHLSRDDEVLANSRAIKVFAGSFCRNPRSIALPWKDKNGIVQSRPGELRIFP